MIRAVERLADDPAFRAEFRDDPHGATRRYRLSGTQVEALKAGDARSLATHGVDVRGFAAGKRRSLWARTRRVAITVATALAGLGLTALPAGAARARDGRVGLRRAVRRSPRMGARLAERSSIRKGLRTGLRAGARRSPRMGLRHGLRTSGRRASLRRMGIRLGEVEEPCEACVEDPARRRGGPPFELAPSTAK